MRQILLGFAMAGLAVSLSSCLPRNTFGDTAAKLSNPTHSALAGKHCDISQDENGVFHTRGADELTAYACLGYLHGRERAFQADFLRRVMQGRLAEILGINSIKTDFFMRVLGLAERAKALFATLPARDKELLWAYTEGVNRGLEAALKKGVYEFKKLGYEPEPWQPEHTLGIIILQSFSETQAGIWQKLKEEKRLSLVSPEAQALFSHDGLPWDTSILKSGEYPAGDKARGTGSGHGFDVPTGSGSNSWVISPKWSASGNAWLANDPHLELTYPPFWFWTHISGGDLDATGVTVPGVPTIPSGFNRNVSWGLTDSYVEAGDLFAVPKEETKTFSLERPTIWVKIGFLELPFVFKTYQRSKEGWPVVPLDAPPGHELVLRWTGFLVKGEGLTGFNELMKAKSVAEADHFFSRFQLPSWNWVFADNKGGIGYRAQGLIPLQETPPPYGVREGSVAEMSRWRMATASEAPHVLEPARGYVVTANNRQWPPGARYYLGRSYPQGFRAFRIEELLTANHRHDFQSLSRIQCDTQAVDARFLVPKLLAFSREHEMRWGVRERKAVELLKAWDFSTGPDCKACGVYLRWVDRIYDLKGLDVAALYRVLDSPGAYKGAIEKSLRLALNDLKVTAKAVFPPYSEIHRADFPHISKSGNFPSKESIATPGDEYSVNVAKADWKDRRYHQFQGASQRLLVRMSDPPEAYFILPGPNVDTEKKDLEAPGSPWVQWRDCRYRKVEFPFDWSKAKAESFAF